MPRRHQICGRDRSPSWYQKDRKPSTSGGDKASDGNAGWSQRDTRGTSSSCQADNTEIWEETKDKISEYYTGRSLETTKDPKQQQR